MKLERKIYCCWFGEKMSNNRFECYESMLKNSKVEVCLITDNNFSSFNSDEYPIHSGFQYLSATHKSDYIRAYMMYRFGGGYSDIKRCNYDWNPYFIELENSNKIGMSCQCTSPNQIPYKPYKDYYSVLSGLTPLIFKPRSTFAKKWIDSVHSLLDAKFNKLKEHPGTYHPRAVLGGVQGEPGIFIESLYPFRWTDLLGKIFHYLQYHHHDDFLRTMPFVDTTNYR